MFNTLAILSQDTVDILGGNLEMIPPFISTCTALKKLYFILVERGKETNYTNTMTKLDVHGQDKKRNIPAVISSIGKKISLCLEHEEVAK